MIDFLYKAQYDVGCSTERAENESLQSAPATATNAGDDHQSAQEPGAPLIVHAKLYILGDKYNIPSLKGLACRNYGELVATQWNTKAFPESAEMIYNNIVVERDILKDVIYEKARSNISTLISEPKFQGLLRRINDLAADILISLIPLIPSEKAGNTFNCHICSSSYKLCGCNYSGHPVISGAAAPLWGYGTNIVFL
jgi:hypothetical protein